MDAREFEHLEFDRARFAPAVLDELREEATKSAEVTDHKVVLHHVYTERRLRPLDLYLREEGEESSRLAIVDYGEAIRDLARSNIFPGDCSSRTSG